MTVPGTSVVLPSSYPQAGGIVIVLEGANGNVYYQFSNPSGMFQGYNNNGTPSSFQGNPLQIAPVTTITCGLQTCNSYFGGSIVRASVRFTAYDGDTKSGDFDFNKITLGLNGFSVGNFSSTLTQTTNTAGTTLIGSSPGFGNNTYDTGWFQSTDAALLSNILSTGQLKSQLTDVTPNDNYWDFRQGSDAATGTPTIIAPGVTLKKSTATPSFAAVGDTISYSYVLKNIGSVWINPLKVSDNKIATVSCGAPNPAPSILPAAAGQVDPGATVACTGTYTVTQADVDAGKVTNIATSIGTPQYATLGAVTDTVTVPGPVASPSVQLTKKASPSPFGAVGTSVTFAFDVRNTGNVTLSSVSISDPLLPSLSCTTASIPPNTTVTATCSGNTKTVTQADFDSGKMTNTATVNAKAPGGAAVSATSAVTISGPARSAGIALIKTAGAVADTNGNGQQDAGDTLSFAFKVTNTGNVTLANVTVTDPKATVVGGPIASLAPGATDTSTFTATYVLQQSDMNVGSVSNQATVTGSAPSGVAGPATDKSDPTSNAGNAQTVKTLNQVKSLSLKKSSPTTSFTSSGTSITYNYLVKNTGTVTLTTPVTISDNKIVLPNAVQCDLWPVAGLAPGATYNCQTTYTIVQADVDAGSLTNLATAASGTTASPQASVTIPVAFAPGIALIKSVGTIADTNSNGKTDVGDIVTFSFTVKNTGNVTLTNVNIADPLPGTTVSGGPIASLAPNVSSSAIQATHPLTQADITAGIITNQATATGTPPTGPPVTDLSDPASNTGNAKTVTAIPQTASIAIIKAPGSVADTNTSGKNDVGDKITYAMTVTNTGTVPLTNVVVSDPKPGVSLTGSPIASLAPGATDSTVVATYTLTQADIDAGTVANQAKASASPPTGPPVTDQSDPTSNTGNAITPTPITQNSSIAVIKTAGTPTKNLGSDSAITDAGDTVTYTFQIKNTGTTTLTNVGVSDLKVSNSCAPVTLAPGATTSCISNPYTITLTDMNAGSLSNQATATGTKPGGGTVTDQSDPASFAGNGPTTIALTQTPKIAVTKSGAAPTIVNGINPGVTDAGDKIAYSFTVKNTGSVTLTAVSVSDPKLTGISCVSSTLAPGDSTACSANDFVLTQADLDIGSVDNQATAVGTAPGGGTVSDQSDPTSFSGNGVTHVTIAQDGKVALVKSASAIIDYNNDGQQDAGDRIVYTFTVTNTGTVTLTNILVVDPLLPVSGGILASLAPGASDSTQFSATKSLTQADIDAGHYDNQAAVTAIAPGGPVSDQSDPSSTTGNSKTVVTIAPVPKLLLNKASSTASFSSVGDVISYTYDVRNIGNITIANSGATAITVSDDKTTVSCPAAPATLAPNATLQCTASYTVTQADIDAGGVTNTATAKSGATISGADAVTVPAIQSPGMTTAKSSTFSGALSAGQSIPYTYVVTNTGNTTIKGPVKVTDNLVASANLSCPAGDIPPAPATNTLTCTGSYTVTTDDVSLGTVTNLASASNGTVTSPQTSLTIPPASNPAVSMTKDADIPTFDHVGQIITYTFKVTNSGNATLVKPVDVIDVVNGNATTANCFTSSSTNPEFNVGETVSCGTTYAITQADMDNGFVSNEAHAETTFGGAPIPVTSPPVPKTVNANLPPPSLLASKAAALSGDLNGNGKIDAGDMLTYTISVQNTGKVTISNISVSDSLIPSLNCSIATLAPTVTDTSCTGTYLVTQTDVDAGQVNNSATASGISPQGAAVSNTGALTTPVAAAVPSLTLAKSASPSPIDAIGQIITYSFTVKNTGNVTLTNVQVQDALVTPAFTCTIPTLLAGDIDSTSCRMPYVVTQADVDAGGVTNSATVSATAARGPNPSATASITTPGPIRQPAMVLNKFVAAGPTVSAGADPTVVDAGDTIDYQFELSNAGNVTIDSPLLTDAKCASGPNLLSGDANANGVLDVKETFVYTCVSVPITQAEVDAGKADNTAKATGTPAGGILAPATASVSTPLSASSSLDAVKTFSTVGLSSPSKAGDVINYTITVKNMGNVTLSNVAIADTLTDALGKPLPLTSAPVLDAATDIASDSSLSPLEIWTYTAFYAITQADIDSGGVKNSAKVSAKTPAGSVVADTSGPAAGTDQTTDTTLSGAGSLDVVKTADASGVSTPPKPGDQINYTITAKNTGNITLAPVTITDTLTDANGNALTLTTGPALNTATDVNADGKLSPAEQWTYAATYKITQADIDSGGVKNSAVVSAKTPGGGAVSDDSGPLSNSNTTTDTPLLASGALDVVKTADASALSTPPKAGETITYKVTAKNTGNVTLDTVSITDTLKDANGSTLTLTSGPALDAATDSGGDGKLSPAEEWSYAAAYKLTQADIDSGGVKNSANVSAKTPGGTTISDDSGPSSGTNATTDTSLSGSGVLDVVKTADTSGLSTPPKPGDLIKYKVTAENKGNVTLSTVTITDTLKDAASNTLALTAGPTLDVNTDIGADNNLSPTEIWTFNATYQLSQSDIDAGGLRNQATISAKTPGNASISDASGPTTGTDATTDTSFASVGALDVIKTADTSALSSPPKAGDVISYKITAENKGNTTLSSVAIVDSLKDSTGSALSLTSGPTLDATTDTSSDAKLSPAEIWTYDATYKLTQVDIDAGGVKNQATVSAKKPDGTAVFDLSGPSTGTDATTDTTVSPTTSLDVIKTADVTGLSNPPKVGDVISYKVTAQNKGNVTLSTVAITDTLTDAKGTTLPLTSGPALDLATDTGNDGSLSPGETWTYIATFALTQAAIDANGLRNSAVVNAKAPGGASVSDVSGPTTGTNATTDTSFTPVTGLDVIKTADNKLSVPPKPGDLVTYAITAKNTGNTTLSSVTISDVLTDAKGNALALTSGPTLDAATDTGADANLSPLEQWTYTATYKLTQADIDSGGVKNQATVSTKAPDNTTVSDPSGPTSGTDGTTDITLTPASGLDVVKTVDASALTSPPLAGDVISYIIFAKNTGNVTLSPVTIVETPTDALGTALTLTSGPVLVASTDTGADGKLAPGEQWTYTATYTLTQSDLDAGGIKNSAKVIGKTPGGVDVSDISGPATGTDATTDFLVPKATVSGTVFLDQNGNGIFDGDPPAGAGYIVELLNSANQVVGTATTKADGTYSISATPGTGYTIVFKNPGGGEIGKIGSLTLGLGANVVNQNQPIDPSGVIYNSITRQPVSGVTVALADASGTPLPSACLLPGQQNQVTNASGSYRFDIIPGAAAACPAAPTTYTIKLTNPGGFLPGFSSSVPPQPGAINVNTCPGDAVPGGSCDVSKSSAPPLVGSAGVYYTSFVLGTGAPDLVNNHIAIEPVASTLTKTANVKTVRLGDKVTYTIAAGSVPFNLARIVDFLPSGLTFVPGTATSNGLAVAATTSNNTLTFDGLIPDATGKISLVLTAVVNTAARPGKLVNRAELMDPATGNVYGNAIATIELVPEHVFDCSDIIGKVFEDKNRNGYEDEGELGLPGVRLATVKGQLIVTDEHGRFHIGCADTPDSEIGSNFILKLDTRTLPSGYRVTTENPRMARLTRGKVVKVNFGASISRVVKLDLNGNVFLSGQTALKPNWDAGLASLVAALAKGPSVLRITYYHGKEDLALAQARLAAVQGRVEQLWSSTSGRYQLPIEARVQSVERGPGK